MTPLAEAAREIFLRTLRECTVEAAFSREVTCTDRVLRVGGEAYDLDAFRDVVVVSIGKAAHSMAAALRQRVGDIRIGIVVAPHDVEQHLDGLEYFVGGHPLPNEESLRAGSEILKLLKSTGADDLVIFLISGGASALVEAPLYPQMRLEDVVAVNRSLLHCGAHIAEMNAVRKHLSALKGGRMALAAAPARQLSLLISDVPERALDALASGPTMPDSSTVEQCYEIYQRYKLPLPESVRELFEQRQLTETPKAYDAAFENSQWHVLLSSETAQRMAAQIAQETGFEVVVDSSCDDWDYEAAAEYLLGKLQQRRHEGKRVCVVNGGEVTVRITRDPGVGGRNQQFALYCAERITGDSVAILSAGTDGIDGNSRVAGAVVDGTTLAAAGGQQVREALENFNSTPLLQSIGATVETGPTGNNLRDLRILCAG
jgi:glycerate 2-kinase